ncbi:unnamed protein product [Victoria cruziana]
MGSRFPSHQLSNGLYVSGRPEQPREKPITIGSAAMPYTGGDIKKSGELGKMFDIPVDGSRSRKSGPISGAPSRTGSLGAAASHSGPITNLSTRAGFSTPGPVSGGSVPGSVQVPTRQKSNFGPLNRYGDSVKKSSGPQPSGVTQMVRQHSGPLAPILPTTGLITSGPISLGSLNSSGAPRKFSGPLDSLGSITNLSHDVDYFSRSFPKSIICLLILLFVMGFIAGGFILGAVQNAILLIVVVVLFGAVAAVFIWNTCYLIRAVTSFIFQYPDAELRTAKNGQYVKVSGVVTCGNVPLESSFQKIPRCVYTATSLYEYRGWDSKAANPTHRRFTWGLRSLERHAVDFYISDFQSGLRALVKAGYGAKVTPFVDEAIIVDINQKNSELPPEFVRWLGERNLSSDDRIMHLKEGFFSAMFLLYVLMIVPPDDAFSTGCQWIKCFFPTNLDGIVLKCEDTSNIDLIPV